MARKSKVEQAAAAAVTAALAASTDQRIDDEDDDLTPEQEDVFRALRELDAGDEIVWHVTKISGPQDERGFIEKLNTSQLDKQRFKDLYGPGDYRVVGFNSSGSFIKGGHKTVKISGIAYKRPDSGAAAPSKDSAAEIIAALEARAAARSSELKSWATILAPGIFPLLAKLFERKSEVTELVQGMAALKGLSPDLPKPEGLESQLDKIIGVLAKLKEAQGEVTPSTGATWVDIIRDGIQGARPLLEGLAGRLVTPGIGMTSLPPPPMLSAPAPFGPMSVSPPPPAAFSAAPVSPPAGAPPGNGNGPPHPAQAQPVGVISLLPWLRQNLEALIYQAGRNKDPGLYASVMLDNLPSGTDPQLLKGFIERADWWAQLQQFAPGVAPYPAWFEEFREEVLEMMNAPPEQAPPAETAAGTSPPAGDGEQEPFT